MKFGVSPSPHPWWIGKIEEFERWIAEAERCEYDAIFFLTTTICQCPCSPLMIL